MNLAGNGNYNNLGEARVIDYEDGSRNLVWDRVGAVYDFSVGGRRSGGLMDVEDTFGVVVDYDTGAESPATVRYVFMNGGISVVRFDTNPNTKVTAGAYYNSDDSGKLTSRFLERPLTIGSRPDLLGGGKLTAVMELVGGSVGDSYPVSEEVVGKKNPLTYAMRIVSENA